jgi:hypothetical protein
MELSLLYRESDIAATSFSLLKQAWGSHLLSGKSSCLYPANEQVPQKKKHNGNRDANVQVGIIFYPTVGVGDIDLYLHPATSSRQE